ncbi:hypothetical protein E0485_06155 [Paenibacillus albiflavus]|uniref:Periplasmic protein n=1 Tax=Paenibacillus albiflavus TaxID=2545760 RepID=A0A4R4EJK1_9BACL|nr:hypothetical protein [Paenibacillus albiflavus]TCZ79440.1 hypothetical protein E0485_06155 [Paenibacillus albiflavus]
MKDRKTVRWSTYEPFFAVLDNYLVADVVVTHHAKDRWNERIAIKGGEVDDICDYVWDKLKESKITPYYKNEKEVFLIEDDLVVVAEFSAMENETDLIGNPLHKMIIVTFLGKLSESLELRDLRTYYSWLRHSRRMTLIKSGRKRK